MPNSFQNGKMKPPESAKKVGLLAAHERDSQGQEPVRHGLRDEANEVRPDARPQARKNRRRTHLNTLRIFQGRARRRWSWIVRRSRTVNVGQAPN